MQNYYQFMMPRLNGETISREFAKYKRLVRKGVAGFIVFGGELDTVRRYVRDLQQAAEIPLIISSDLERGLGQQLMGGTLFPPAMALGRLYKRLSATSSQQSALKMIRRSFRAATSEAKYAGINVIFAPVLDINTNPGNPIISVRAFGEDSDTVSLLGKEMITAFQRGGISACGKHFPGHGDTSIDSHIGLPLLKHKMGRLRQCELRPFEAAIKADVDMIMLGHLSVPAIDSSGIPVSFSKKAVRFLRDDMGFKGLLVTDALNMGGIGSFSEAEAALKALEAGVDIILHPSDPDEVAGYLQKYKPDVSEERLVIFRKALRGRMSGACLPDFAGHRRLAKKIIRESISRPGVMKIKGMPVLVILNDDADNRGSVFEDSMKRAYPGMKMFRLKPGMGLDNVRKRKSEFIVAAIFSDTRAWKGGASSWLKRKIASLGNYADLFISFGSPYLLEKTGDVLKMDVYWDSDEAQKAAAESLVGK